MSDYRVYVFDDRDHIINRIDIVCPDDRAATEYARRYVGGADIELWRMDRLITRFRSKDAIRLKGES